MHAVTLEPLSTTRPRFHLWMGGIFVAIALAGFFSSYWGKLASGTFTGAPILHIHGALFFAWTALYLVQTMLVASGRTALHRAWGVGGVAIFSVMICTAAALGIHSMQTADRLGMGDAGRQFAVVTFTTLALMVGLFVAGIVNVRRPEVHKRLMLLVTIMLVQPGIARLCALLFAPAGAHGPPPLIATVPTGFLTDALILAAIIHDWRTRGRPHSTYVYAGLVILAVQLVRIPLGQGAAWMSFAKALQGLMG